MEFEHSGFEYRVSKLDAMRQFHIARKIAPIMAGLAPAAGGSNEDALSNMASAISKLSDEDSESVLHGLLSCVARKEQKGLGWSKVDTGSALMFSDIDLKTMMQLSFKSLQHNFSDFFSALTQNLPGANSSQSGQ